MGLGVQRKPQQVLHEAKDHFARREPGCVEHDYAPGKEDFGRFPGPRGGLLKHNGRG